MDSPERSAAARLRRFIVGYRLSQALRVVAELGVADLLADAARTAAELAAATGADADALARVLRLLASEGVFAEVDGKWRLTALAQPLRGDVAQSMRRRAINDGEPANWAAWGQLPHSVRTGESGALAALGAPLFRYLSSDPAAASSFDRLMAEQTAGWSPSVIEAYDFRPYRAIVDVGGGRGALLAAILAASPHLTGILVDLPHVVPDATSAFARAGLAERAKAVGGDFFVAVPSGDLYTLKQVLHDWNDADAVAILKSCRRSIAAAGRLLIVEVVLGAAGGDYARYLDVHMLVLTGGRERTTDAYEALLAAAGFRLVRVIPTRCELSLIEASPA